MNLMAGRADGGGKGKCSPHMGIWKAFDGWTECNSTTTFYCPATEEELQKIVSRSKQVRSTGAGHSWTAFTCTSGFASEAATLDMRGFNKIYGIDAERSVVRVQGGVTVRDLLNYLSQHKYKLLTWSWFIDQTVAGAVATATHGADTQPGRATFSSLVRTMTLVKADGSIVKVDRDQEPELMNVVAVGVGKMGVITELELDIEADFCIRSEVSTFNEDEFLGLLKKLETPEGHKAVGDYAQGEQAYDMFWFPFDRSVTGGINKKDPPGCDPNHRSDMTSATVALLALLSESEATGKQMAKWRLANPEESEKQIFHYVKDASFCTKDCWASTGRITNALFYSKVLLPRWKYDMFEFAVPFEKAHTCFDKFFNEVAAAKESRRLFSGEPVLIRFVGQADQLLVATTDGPHVYVNMDVDVAFRPHSASECSKWDEIYQHFLSDACSGRLHFGKAGWDRISAKQADAMYPGLPQFRAKMQEWDPKGKFTGSSPIFDPAVPAPDKGTCMGTSPDSMEACASAERQVSSCMCTTPLPWAGQQDGESASPACEWRLQAAQELRLPAETMQCIEQKASSATLEDMIEAFEGRGPTPATTCAVVPKSGFYRGIAGKNVYEQPGQTVGWRVPHWLGKSLKGCTSKEGGKCTARSLVNYMEQPKDKGVAPQFNGGWGTTTSWGDDKPCAIISYPEEMPSARDELRPWCLCGVRTFLGLLWFGDRSPDMKPWLSFVLVPPDASAGDCPAVQDEGSMCNA